MIRFHKTMALLVLGVLAFFGLARSAAAAGILTIPPVAFRPIDSASDNKHKWFANEQALYVDYSVDGPYFAAPVYLPNGAKVKRVTVYLTDNGTSTDDEVRVFLHRQNLSSGELTTMSYLCNHTPELPHSSNRQAMVDKTISNSTINNGQYSYTVYVWFIFSCTDKVKFHGIKIEY